MLDKGHAARQLWEENGDPGVGRARHLEKKTKPNSNKIYLVAQRRGAEKKRILQVSHHTS